MSSATLFVRLNAATGPCPPKTEPEKLEQRYKDEKRLQHHAPTDLRLALDIIAFSHALFAVGAVDTTSPSAGLLRAALDKFEAAP